MNKFLKSLIIMAACVGTFGALTATTSCGNCDYNKTFMNPRSHGTNLALLHGAGINEIINRKDKNKFGGTLQAIFFYQDGDHDAQYWTPYNENCFSLANEKAMKGLFPTFIQGLALGTDVSDSKITFDPEQDAYGVTLAYDQRLDSLLKGLYFRVQLPIVHVNNDLNVKIEGTDKEDIEKYLKGDAIDAKMKALTHAKIGGCGDSDTTGIADIDVLLGYTFLNQDDYHASLNIGVTIPTGTDADGKVLNEAVVGNGQHFGLGAGLTFDARLWGDKEHNIILYAELKYRYLFEASENRTMGIADMGWGHYLPLFEHSTTFTGGGTGSSGWDTTSAPVAIPAANILTLNVDVTPGSEFDGIIALAYNNGGFGANLGYNLYFREGEDVDLKCGCDGKNIFEEKTYSYINESAAPGFAKFKALTKDDLVKYVAETCSQTTHKIFGGLAWTFKDWETPVNVGIGAHYEWADGRRANEGWGINGRAAIGF